MSQVEIPICLVRLILEMQLSYKLEETTFFHWIVCIFKLSVFCVIIENPCDDLSYPITMEIKMFPQKSLMILDLAMIS